MLKSEFGNSEHLGGRSNERRPEKESPSRPDASHPAAVRISCAVRSIAGFVVKRHNAEFSRVRALALTA